MRALLVEDDSRLRTILHRALARAGLACDEAASIEEAQVWASAHEYALVLLDRMLPDGDGIEFCRELRAGGYANAILMLTALDDARSTVDGLTQGADDYLGKPFDTEVLEARVKALLRRNQRRPTAIVEAGDLQIDPWRREARLRGQSIALTSREFVILETLARSAGAVVSRTAVLEEAWGEHEEPMSNTIDVLMARLRRKLEELGAPGMIETIRGAGYRLRA
jgi:DNA-binding response OmpR family regulator